MGFKKIDLGFNFKNPEIKKLKVGSSLKNSQNPLRTPIKAKAIDINMATRLVSTRLIAFVAGSVLHKSSTQHVPDFEHNKRAFAPKSMATALLSVEPSSSSFNCLSVACSTNSLPTAGKQPRSPATRPFLGLKRPPAVCENSVDSMSAVANYFLNKKKTILFVLE